MNIKKGFKISYGIRARFLTFSLGLILLSIAVVVYITVNSIQAAGAHAQQEGEASLRAQTEEFLSAQIVESAGQDSLLFERVGQDAENLAKFTANVFDNPSAFAHDSYWKAADHMFVGLDGQHMNSDQDVSTVFIPNSVTLDDKYIQDLELSSYLDMVFPSIYNNNSNTAAVYLITKTEITRLYPNINLGTIIPGDYLATQDIFFTIGAPQNNPEHKVVWTPVYNDPAGQGLLVSAIAPIYTARNQFIGVIGIDVSLTGLTAKIENQELTAGGYSLLVDQDGRALALPDQGYIDILGRTRTPGEYAPDLKDVVPGFAPIVNDMTSGEAKFQTVTVGDKELFVAYASLPSTGWIRVNVFDAEKMLESASLLRTELESSTRSLISTRILPAGLGIVLMMAVIGIILTNRLVNPIRQLAEGAQRIGAGEWNTQLPEGGRDEIGALAQAFNAMTSQLRELFGSLEQRVADRTKALTTSAEVSRRLTSILDPRELAREVVNQVQTAFNYYYAQIYLFDGTGENLVLTAGTGEAGAEMMKRGHALPKGRGLVGRAAENNLPVLVPDTSQASDWLPNELLPDTKAEAAIPIAVGDRVLGVLDVQDDVTNDINSDDITLLESLAAQVAISLQNADSYARAETALQEAKSLVDYAAEGILVLDLTNGLFAEPNENAAKIYGLSREELVKVGPAQMSPPTQPDGRDSTEKAMEMIGTAMEKGINIFEWNHINGQGDEFPCEIRLVRLPGEHPRLRVTVTDITERKHLQELTALRARQQEAINLITQRIQAASTIEEAMQVAARELGHALGKRQTLVALSPSALRGGIKETVNE